MKLKTLAVGLVALTTIITTSCNTLSRQKKEIKTTPVETPVGTDVQIGLDNSLLGEWYVIQVGSTQVKAVDDTYPTVTFDDSGCAPGTVKIYANNGCNYLNGQYKLKGNTLTQIGDMAATMKYCPDAEYEIPITEALNEMNNFTIQKINNEYFLNLKNGPEEVVMILKKHNMNFLDGAWRVTDLTGTQLSGETAPEIVIDLENNKVHGNAGCNVLNGKVTSNPDREGGLNFTDLFTTRMTCPEIAIEQGFIIALEQVESCVPGDTDDVAYLKDGDGKTLITLKRINLK